MLKIKEEFDYKSLSRRLDIQLETLIAEHERQQKAFRDEIEQIALEAQNRIAEAETNYADALEVSHLSLPIWSITQVMPRSRFQIWILFYILILSRSHTHRCEIVRASALLPSRSYNFH